ncbi:Histone-Lysine N-Methyltransferase ash1l [Rhizophlyctis rosea]|uniref:Histone-Lysine N-Methyltransferase ash1l n=1 Tax=Rhizophlyctis rosea TaxID=64517 RepID=A0AAD5SI38_9FUNG|nr:Histone-Lysine N-Methyltransferase ash1l [Rhizophlyctis rosea]
MPNGQKTTRRSLRLSKPETIESLVMQSLPAFSGTSSSLSMNSPLVPRVLTTEQGSVTNIREESPGSSVDSQPDSRADSGVDALSDVLEFSAVTQPESGQYDGAGPSKRQSARLRAQSSPLMRTPSPTPNLSTSPQQSATANETPPSSTQPSPTHPTLNQITAFFRRPVTNMYCEPTDPGCEFGGFDAEHALRRCLSEDGKAFLPDNLKLRNEESCFAKTFANTSDGDNSDGGDVDETGELGREPPRKRLKTTSKSPSLRKTLSKKATPKSSKTSQPRKSKTLTPKPLVARQPIRRQLWGKLARDAEALWDGEGALKELYAKKKFLPAGLFSSTFKTNKPFDTKLRMISAEGFKFLLPVNCGEGEFEEMEFELPYDLELFMEEAGGPEKLRRQIHQSGPTPFTKIQRNIFVDRKPRKLSETPVCTCVVPADGSMGCGESCLNRCMFIECDPKSCALGDKCSNQAFQRRECVSALEVHRTEQRGFGLRTKVAIPQNTLVIEYRGEIISQERCIERMESTYKGLENYYFLNYAKNEVIDACRKGTEARFANHSCDPNCHIEKWNVGGEFRVGLVATKDIPAGGELTYDYRFESFGPAQSCLCGSANCRGRIGKSGDSKGDTEEKESASDKPTKPTKSSKKTTKSQKKSSKPKHNIAKEKKLKPQPIPSFNFDSRDVTRIRKHARTAKLFLVRNLRSAFEHSGGSSSRKFLNRKGVKGNKKTDGQKLERVAEKCWRKLVETEDVRFCEGYPAICKREALEDGDVASLDIAIPFLKRNLQMARKGMRWKDGEDCDYFGVRAVGAPARREGGKQLERVVEKCWTKLMMTEEVKGYPAVSDSGESANGDSVHVVSGGSGPFISRNLQMSRKQKPWKDGKTSHYFGARVVSRGGTHADGNLLELVAKKCWKTLVETENVKFMEGYPAVVDVESEDGDRIRRGTPSASNPGTPKFGAARKVVDDHRRSATPHANPIACEDFENVLHAGLGPSANAGGRQRRARALSDFSWNTVSIDSSRDSSVDPSNGEMNLFAYKSESTSGGRKKPATNGGCAEKGWKLAQKRSHPVDGEDTPDAKRIRQNDGKVEHATPTPARRSGRN